MKTGILINARLGSTRLKRKHLLPVDNQPIIAYLFKRIMAEFHNEIQQHRVQVMVATGDEAENRDFTAVLPNGAAIHYGSVNNIPLRHVQAAQAYDLDLIISIDGDDILCSTAGMRLVFAALNQGQRYVRTAGLPFGMNSFGYSSDFLAASLRNYADDQLETGWGRIFDSSAAVDITSACTCNDNRLRFTLDYEQDFQFFQTVIQKLGNKVITVTDNELVRMVLSENLWTINECITTEYWENFYRRVNEEQNVR